MKKLVISIVLFMLFAALADAAVPGEDKEFQSGVKCYNSRNYKAAVKHLQEYVDRQPDPAAYYLIGYSMYKLGRFAEADEYFSEAYLIDPEFSLQKVSRIKKYSEEILPKGPEAANGTVAAFETKSPQQAVQTAKPEEGAFAKQKAGGGQPAYEAASTPSPELQQLALAPQFMEPAAPSEIKKSAVVNESALEHGTEYEEITDENNISDPLETWNRAMFKFNDRLYFLVAKPLAGGYSAIVPEWGRVRVKNIFQNISVPVRFVNNLLQLKIWGAETELLRFVFNTTAGVGGMFDVAKNIDLKNTDEDLGQTLGAYGIDNGFYLVWPVLGSSSFRDTVGTAGDFFLEPVSYITPAESLIGVRSFDYTNETSLHIGDYEDMKESAIDPYVSFRSAYSQYRKNKIKE